MSREKLEEGRDFESGWIEEATFEPRGSGVTGICSVVIKGGRYGYIVSTEHWKKFKSEARRSLEFDDASTGAAYNKYLKRADVKDAIGLGQVQLPNGDEEAPDVPHDDA